MQSGKQLKAMLPMLFCMFATFLAACGGSAALDITAHLTYNTHEFLAHYETHRVLSM